MITNHLNNLTYILHLHRTESEYPLLQDKYLKLISSITGVVVIVINK